mgnify:CR=1 FL=1
MPTRQTLRIFLQELLAEYGETADFSDDTSLVISGMLDSLAEYTRRHPLPAALEGSALLVLDMQAYFLDDASHAFIPSAPAILPRVNALISAYARRDLPVFLSRHFNTPQNAGRMADWWQDLIRPDSPLNEIGWVMSKRGRHLHLPAVVAGAV